MTPDDSPRLRTPPITTRSADLAPRDIDAHAAVVLLLAPDTAVLRTLAYGRIIAERMRRAGRALDDPAPFVTELPNRRGTCIALAALKPGMHAFDRLTLARRLIAEQTQRRAGELVLATAGLDRLERDAALEALLAAALAADFPLPDYRRAAPARSPFTRIVLHGPLPDATIERTVASALGNNLARHLTALPPNRLTPTAYRRAAQTLARAHGWRSEFFDLKKLRRLGAGAFLAVARGSGDDGAGILRLRYTPRARTRRAPLALVGKGICFDTGGVNLKSAAHMYGMHGDMQGSAVALGVLLALTRLKVDFPVDCWLALAQNHIGPGAYRPNEVVRCADGTAIEIVHTDAEGRLVLADTLTLAARTRPANIIDYATLTGSCVAALGARMSGVLTNRRAWLAPLIEAGERSGERVWPFPLPDDYDELLKSDVADVKQCTVGNDADHILAALLLRRFVPADIGWLHVDLAARRHAGGLAHVPTDVTGFGVRFTLTWLLDAPSGTNPARKPAPRRRR